MSGKVSEAEQAPTDEGFGVLENAFYLFSKAILFVALLFSFTAVAGLLGPPAELFYSRKLAVAVFLGAAVSPSWVAFTILVMLPIFGNKPATPQLFYLILVSSSFLVGAFARRTVYRLRHAAAAKIIADTERVFSTHPMSVMTVTYLLASVLSLTTLPLGALFQEAQGPLLYAGLYGFLASIFRFISQDEGGASYPILSVMLTVQAYAFGYEIFRSANRANLESSERRLVKYKFIELSAPKFGYAILVGLLLSWSVGLLDYYGKISLLGLRDLDPVVNAGGVQFRIQSFFGHSGWFAEFVTLTVPFSVLILSLRWRFSLRVFAILVILLLGEYILVLTYQRGGWVSYPLTLFAVWAAIYVAKKIESGSDDILGALRGSFFKVVLSLPLTILITLLLIRTISNGDLGIYASRFQDIQRTSDRTDFMRAGWKIGMLHPFLGAGSESFCSQFDKEFVSSLGHFHGEIDLPLHGTAHNVYFQTFAGKGFIGLALLIAMVGTLIFYSCKKALAKDTRSVSERCVLLACACFGAAFFIYGVVQEMFYVHSLQLLFFAVIFISLSTLKDRKHLSSHALFSILILFLLGTIAHLGWEATYSSTSAPSYGCYGEEMDEAGRTFRWCGPNARLELPVTEEFGKKVVSFGLTVEPLTPVTEKNHVSIAVSGIRKVLSAKDIVGVNQKITIPLETLDESTLGDDYAHVDISLNSGFVPKKVFPESSDLRVLSFRVYK